jgi:hypothetical protein
MSMVVSEAFKMVDCRYDDQVLTSSSELNTLAQSRFKLIMIVGLMKLFDFFPCRGVLEATFRQDLYGRVLAEWERWCGPWIGKRSSKSPSRKYATYTTV